MKKTLVILGIGLLFGGMVYAQRASEVSIIGDENNALTSSTNYTGYVVVDRTMADTPSTNLPVWKIVRIKVDANGLVLEKKTAYGDGVGDNASWSATWTNRVSATYK